MLPVGQVRLGPRRERHQIWVRNLVSAQGLREKQRVRVSSPQIKTVPGDIGELLDKQKKAHCPMTGTHCHCLTAGKAVTALRQEKHCYCSEKTVIARRQEKITHCHNCLIAGEKYTLPLPEAGGI